MSASRSRRLLGSAFGTGIDRALGEPPLAPHPLAVFGTVMQRVEQAVYADSRWRGAAHAAIGVTIGAAVGGVLCDPALATYLAVGGRGLADAAVAVHEPLARGDLDAARAALPALVGRDPRELGPEEIARAVVESVAENTVDAVVAPALWAAAAGAPGALGYRAVNTLDAMVGHRDDRYERFGWASARLDDAANWLPARGTAILVAAVRPRRAAEVARAVRQDAPGHPSPNAGVAEAAFAAALDLRLGGTNRYGERLEDRAPLGRGHAATPADIPRATALSRDVTIALVGLLAGAGVSSLRRRQ
jgi:adenosylcobinamide-phosphate synthase